MWTLLAATRLIQERQAEMHELGYHITLGGGVLNMGSSKKDLDLFILRKNNVERKSAYDVILALAKGWGIYRALRDSPDYGPDTDFHFSEAVMFTIGGKRVDVFVQ